MFVNGYFLIYLSIIFSLKKNYAHEIAKALKLKMLEPDPILVGGGENNTAHLCKTFKHLLRSLKEFEVYLSHVE